MAQRKARIPKKIQYKANQQETHRRVIRTNVEGLKSLFENRERDAEEIKNLHLSSRVLFQRYVKDVRTRLYSSQVKSLIKKIEQDKISRVSEKNLIDELSGLKKLKLIPEKSSGDSLEKNFPNVAKIFAKLENGKKMSILSNDEKEEIIWYLKILSVVLTKPWEFFVNAVKHLRSVKYGDEILSTNNRNYILGCKKSGEAWAYICRSDGLNVPQDLEEQLPKFVDAIKKAFENY